MSITSARPSRAAPRHPRPGPPRRAPRPFASWEPGCRTSKGFLSLRPFRGPNARALRDQGSQRDRRSLSRFEPRPTGNLDSPTENCSTITIDFLVWRPALSLHLKGKDLPSPGKRFPITEGSRARIEEWLGPTAGPRQLQPGQNDQVILYAAESRRFTTTRARARRTAETGGIPNAAGGSPAP
jgi:hypothetical protein